MKNTAPFINLEAIIPNELAGKRFDQILALLFPDYSRTCLQNWIQEQKVTVDGAFRRPRDRLHGGEKIVIAAELPEQEAWAAEPIDLNIVYEDDALIVLNKPVGLVVHPAPGNLSHTLVNALLHHAPSLSVLPRAGIVHRLDKDTSGLLVVAKTMAAHTNLIKQLQERTVSREYQAIVNGEVISGGTLETQFGRHLVHRKRMAVLDAGKTAITHYRVLEKFNAHTLLQVKLETGRTHQIRVHMAHIKHPIVGDVLYGGRYHRVPHISDALHEVLKNFKHQALHAEKLGLIHPVSGEYVEWHAPLPDDMVQLIEALRNDNSNYFG